MDYYIIILIAKFPYISVDIVPEVAPAELYSIKVAAIVIYNFMIN